MQCVILAAGRGTRMQPLTYDIPKPMLPIKGKPILEYTLEFLPSEIDEVIFVVNYLGKHIQKYFGNEWQGRKINYIHQDELNGTGGAVYGCKRIVRGEFMVLMGDDLYYKKDLEKMCQEDFAILAYEVDDPTRFGVFRTDEKGNLIDIVEKPKDKTYKLVNTGAYIINEKFFDYKLVPISEKEFGLPQTLVAMAKDYQIKIMPATYWHPVGYPEDLKNAEKELKKFIKTDNYK